MSQRFSVVCLRVSQVVCRVCLSFCLDKEEVPSACCDGHSRTHHRRFQGNQGGPNRGALVGRRIGRISKCYFGLWNTLDLLILLFISVWRLMKWDVGSSSFGAQTCSDWPKWHPKTVGTEFPSTLQLPQPHHGSECLRRCIGRTASRCLGDMPPRVVETQATQQGSHHVPPWSRTLGAGGPFLCLFLSGEPQQATFFFLKSIFCFFLKPWSSK